MKIEARKTGREPPELPFTINRTLREDISTQVTDGIRRAILTGFYRSGDLLPTVLEFARGLGVSIRAPQAALHALTREGLVSPRPRLGTVVVGPRPGVFHGRILLVTPNINPIYYDTVLETRLCANLTEAGYLVTRLVTPIVGDILENLADERFDVRQLETDLRQSTKLVVIFGSHPHIERVVSRSGTPFVVVGPTRPQTPGCVGYAALQLGRALDAILARLRARGVRRLVQVAMKESELMDAAALGTVCSAVEPLVIRMPPPPLAKQDRIVRSAFETFAARYRSKADLPDAFLFTDDYLARGALLALLSAGIRTGSDVLVMTLSISGVAPIHPDPVDLLNYDPERDAGILTDAVLSNLRTGSFPAPLAFDMALLPDQ